MGRVHRDEGAAVEYVGDNQAFERRPSITEQTNAEDDKMS